MKIALVAQHATLLRPRARLGPGSDDIGLRQLTSKLADRGHQVTIYVQKQQLGTPNRAKLRDGVRVQYIDAGPVPANPASGKQDDAALLDRVPAFSGPLRSFCERERPDVVHALRWTSGLAALVAVRDQRIPMVQEFSSLGLAERRGGVRANGAAAARIRLEPVIGRSAAAVIATHSAEVLDLTSLGVHRSAIKVVPCGVDTSTFTPEGPAAKRNGRPRLVTVADLTERAGLEPLLRALTQVPEAELLVVGGPARAELRADAGYVYLARLVGALGISDRVIFAGKIAYGAMPKLLRSADLVVSTCQDEPSGMTSLQAMACGRPVVAPPVGGHADAVVDGITGILIRLDRPALLARRIRRLIAHPMMLEAYGLAAADRARARYSWDRIAAEMLSVYDKAAGVPRLKSSPYIRLRNKEPRRRSGPGEQPGCLPGGSASPRASAGSMPQRLTRTLRP